MSVNPRARRWASTSTPGWGASTGGSNHFTTTSSPTTMLWFVWSTVIARSPVRSRPSSREATAADAPSGTIAPTLASAFGRIG